MRIQATDIDAIFDETCDGVGQEDGCQFLHRMRYRISKIVVICYIADSESRKIDKAHPSELEPTEEFKRMGHKFLESVACC